MTDRRGDQGFAVAPIALSGGRGRKPRKPRQIGVTLVVLASLALVVVAFLGPRISGPPNFDIGYFATPTPRDTPTPSPTPTFPNLTPTVTPLPEMTRPDGAPALDGELLLAGNDIERLDLETGNREPIASMTAWQDGLFRLADDRIACICVVGGFDERGATRSVKLVSIGGGATVTSELASYAASPDAVQDQPDPLIDAVVDRAAQTGLLAVATRTATDWRLSVRGFDPRAGTSGPEVPIGTIAIPPLPDGGPSPTPRPSDAEPYTNIYLDGPHVRLAPDGRTAFVWAVAQRYPEEGEATFTRGAWRIQLAGDGAGAEVADVTAAPDLLKLPVYCLGTSFVGNDRFVAICGEQNQNDPTTRWTARSFDLDGRLISTFTLPTSQQYGYGEPLFDDANNRLFLWDPVGLTLVRLDLGGGAVATTTFDPADQATPGVASVGGVRAPIWHDADSAVQQSMFEQIAGSADGSRLYATGFQMREETDYYGQRSLGVFVIDSATLALVQHWAPVANDGPVTILADGRVAVGGQPGINANGDQVPWEGSLTIHEAADGTIVARYGRVSVDMPPVVIRP